MYMRKPKMRKKEADPEAAVQAKTMIEEKDFNKRIGNYQLMEAIGRGGFGVVYRGLCITSAETVAVKRINLLGIPKEELESIEMEIRLLQGLMHPNIVKYRDAIRSEGYLNIILEFVENGSLSSLLSTFGGQFPEELVAHYIAQVVLGLSYLHNQGVIHRDIKGANILSTKEGLVKLADFGVATKLNESRQSDSVVGTPYWMAPEIIEMTGQQSPACDIWSVGCTVIELITGKPPYFDLQQMPALFRIVQDEHPPLPDNISPACESFLLECFQKDPNRRIDAAGLHKHPWIKEIIRELDQKASGRERSATHAPLAESNSASGKDKGHGTASTAASSGGKDKDKDKDKGSRSTAKEEEPEDWDAEIEAEQSAKAGPQKGAAAGAGASNVVAAKSTNVSVLSPRSGELFQKTTSKDLKASGSAAALSKINGAGVGPESAGTGAALSNKSGGGGSVPEDDDDMEWANVDGPSISKAAASANAAGAGSGTGSNNLLGATKSASAKDGAGAVHSQGRSNKAARGALSDEAFADMSDDDEIFSGSGAATSSGSSSGPGPGSGSGSGSLAAGGGGGGVSTISGALAKSLVQFTDKEDEDEKWADDIAVDGKVIDKLKQPRSQKAWDAPASEVNEDEADPFDKIDFDDNTDDTSAVLARFDKLTRQLTATADEATVQDTCAKLAAIVAENPLELRSSVTCRGVIPIMEMLEVQNPNVLISLLKLVNQIVVDNPKFQQNMSLVGLIPAVVKFSGRAYPTGVRLEAASFIRHICYNSDNSRKMFVACGGIPALVGFLHEDYSSAKALVWNAIDCIRHIFDITSSPRNDFCRLFCKAGLLPPLARTLLSVHADSLTSSPAQPSGVSESITKDPKTAMSSPAEYVKKIATVLEWFSIGDQVVKTHFADPVILEVLIKILPTLPQDVLIVVLKSLRSISMDPTALDVLEKVGAIPALMPFLNSKYSENQSQVLIDMYYLCSLKQSRQEQAATSGIVPHLQRFIRTKHPLNQFAYPVIFALGKTSSVTRQELKKHGGVQFYLDVLKDPYWRTHALESLATWLAEDTERVGFTLTTPSNICKLLTVFKTTRNVAQFETILPMFRRVLTGSVRVNHAIGIRLVPELVARLKLHENNNNIRVNVLQILRLIITGQNSASISDLMRAPEVWSLLQELSRARGFPIVASLAENLIHDCENLRPQLSSRPASGGGGTQNGVAAAPFVPVVPATAVKAK